jgi:transposase
MGERTLRRLLIIGASAVARWAARKGAPAGSWLERMLRRTPGLSARVEDVDLLEISDGAGRLGQ